MKTRRFTQRGGASLITTVILAIVLLGIVGGLTTLSIRELRQASNVEQSNRALSAAEGYVEKLANQISTEAGPHDRPACNSAVGSSTTGPPISVDNNLDITCAVVTTGLTTDISGTLDRDGSFRMSLAGSVDESGTPTPVGQMSIDWGDTTQTATIPSPIPPWPSLISGNWGAGGGAPAALELSYTWWSSGASIMPLSGPTDYGLPLARYLVNPGGNVASASIKTVCDSLNSEGVIESSRNGAICHTQTGNNIVIASAAPGSAPTDNVTFKLTSRYNGTKFLLRFYDASGTKLLKLPAPYAVIDVTARSNNLYRRVIAHKDLDQVNTSSIFESIVFSGKNICKDMRIDKADYGSVKDTSGTIVGDGKNSSSCEN